MSEVFHYHSMPQQCFFASTGFLISGYEDQQGEGLTFMVLVEPLDCKL